jgi:hypothetical protein
MIIQVILTILALVVICLGLVHLGRATVLANALILSGGFGIYSVWNPSSTTAVANALGVGRGADLLIYLSVVVSTALLLLLYIQLRRQMILITNLARHIAIQEAHRPVTKTTEVES